MREPEPCDWHALTSEHSLQQLHSSDAGLTSAQAAERLQEHGLNQLPQRAGLTPWRRFLLQFHNLLIYVLLASMAMTLVLGQWLDSAVIFAVVLINALIGFIQEGKAEQAMRAIQSMLTVDSRVRRDGEVLSLAAEQLVPGDVVLLDAGDRVPADLRLLEVRDLRIEEAALTGESLPVAKQIAPVAALASLGDRRCMAYSGTLVSAGSGCGVIVATGEHTELGRISHLLGAVTALQTPLLVDMSRFARYLTLIIVALAGLTFAFGVWLRGYSASDMLMASVGLAVAAIPEGLPAVLTIILALGVQRMARRRAIIRRLPAVESLGAVTVICSDKTGTLTRNEMTVQQVFTAGHHYQVEGVGYAPHGSIHCDDGQLCSLDSAHDLRELARAGLLANNASLALSDQQWQISGDPIAAALLTLAGKLGLQLAQEHQQLPQVDSIPFSSERRYLATLHHDHSGHGLIYVVGAPERLLALCNRQWRDGHDEPLNLKHWRARLEQGASQGLRMIGLALRTLPQVQHELNYADIDGDFVLLGLVGMLDPPREEVIRAIADCHSAGIRVKMITGDHAATAASIARSLGLNSDAPLTGVELDTLSDAELDARLATTEVFARTNPSHKLRLVERLQALGEAGGDDRRWRQRCAGTQACRYRHCHGHQGHRGGQGSGADGVGRRQFRHHHPRGGRGSGGLRHAEKSHSVYPAHQWWRGAGVAGGDCLWPDIADHTVADSLDQYDYCRDLGLGPGLRAGRARADGPTTARSAHATAEPRAVMADCLDRHADDRGQPRAVCLQPTPGLGSGGQPQPGGECHGRV